MTAPAASILLPIYNGSRFLADQIESVCRQTFREFELLIHDDGSTDGSRAIALSWRDKDSRISLTGTDRNAGHLVALRGLLDGARSQRIAFCDQDDVWDVSKLERLVERLPRGGLAYGMSALINDHGRSLNKTIFDHTGPPFAGSDTVGLLAGNKVSAHSMLVDRSCIPAPALASGSVFDWSIAVVASVHGGIVFDPRAITFHRQHGANFNNNLHSPRKRYQSDGSERLQQWSRLFEALAAHRDAEPRDIEAFRAFAAACAATGRDPERRYVWQRELISSGSRALECLNGSDRARNGVMKSLSKASRGSWHPRLWLRQIRMHLQS